MAEALADVLASARAALMAIGPPVRLAGDDDPDGDEVIVLADVADTNVGTYGLEASIKRVQVACYAQTKLRALDLDRQCRKMLRQRGFSFIQSRPAPAEDDFGQISDYRR